MSFVASYRLMESGFTVSERHSGMILGHEIDKLKFPSPLPSPSARRMRFNLSSLAPL